MNFIHSITFRLTLWYMAILSILLVLLGSGVYFTLSRVLYGNLDDSLKTRAEQLARFRNIMSIVAGGTFEEEIGEYISFYYYDGSGKLRRVSNKKIGDPSDTTAIDRAIAGVSSYSTEVFSPGGRLRIYMMPYLSERKNVSPEHATPSPGRSTQRNNSVQFPPGLDFDDDGYISPEELISHETEKFSRIDENGDGLISRTEMARDERRPGRRPKPGRDDRFEKKDGNSDGAISLDEFLADERIRFRRLDAGRDGRLSPNEMNEDRGGGNRRDERRPERLVIHEHEGQYRTALVVARPTKDIETALERLFQIFAIAIPITVLCSFGGGIFLSKRAFRPVEEIRKTAQEIEEKDLSRRIDVSTKDELGRLAATLNQMIARLQSAFERQKQFTGDASHELRAPLAVIQAEATLSLSKERAAREYRKSIEMIAQEAEHMAGLIRQLLTLARADAGKEQLTFEHISLTAFIQDFCSDVEILCRKKNIRLEVNLAEKIAVKGDRRSLRQLMHNLVSNAIRYTPEGGAIRIKLRRGQKWIVLSVADTGIGIPASDIPLLFKRFYRVDKARSRSEGGSGLGLAICKHIVDVHKGKIIVKRNVGEGSVFYVRLPVIKAFPA